MKRFMSDMNYKFIAGILALFLVSFFLASPAAAAGPEDYIIVFQADRTQIPAGQCVNIYWHTDNVQTVYYNNQPVSGINQNRVECPRQSTTYELEVTTRNGQKILKQIHVDVIGGVSDWGRLVMQSNQMIDVDRGGRVSANEDDFRWIWLGEERGGIVKADDDEDLRLAVVREGSSSSFDRLSQDDCRSLLDDNDSDQIEARERTIVCFRTDEDNLGKFRVQDIRRTNGRLELDWAIWD